MGIIRSGLFISLDGVVEAPDTWHFSYFDDAMGAAVGALMSGNDASLLGRNTYDQFAAYWPTADPADPTTSTMNESRKYVVSNTLTDPAWQNTTVINGDVARAITGLKAEGQSLGVTGSGTLVRWLLEQRLLDELHLFIHPVVVGHGKRLWGDNTGVSLTLASSEAFPTGVIHAVYGPAIEE